MNFKIGDLVKRTAGPEYDYLYMKSGEVYTISALPAYCRGYMLVEGFNEMWDMKYFELYLPEQYIDEVEPTDDLQSKLTEALSKIESLESALEDAVKRIDNWRNGRSEGHGLKDEEYTAIPAVNQEEGKLEQGELEFKPISEMTREDWELAEKGDWVFETREGKHILVVAMTTPPLENYAFRASNHYYYTCKGLVFPKSEDEGDIIKRIK